jgi:hypothetical protein
LVIAENGKPIIARLSRCIDGKTGARLLAGQSGLRAKLTDRCRGIAADSGPTGEPECRKPAVGAAFPGAGAACGVGVSGI